MKDIIKDIKDYSTKEYGSLPFWSWNGKLNDAQLRKQINDMHEIGMNGFFMHARGGLETEYLSDEWFHAVSVSVAEAEKLGMEAWAYDENGWPSGFAGGKLLDSEKNVCKYLSYKISEDFDSDAFAAYIISDNKAVKVTEPDCNAQEYFLIYRCFDYSYVDTMDREVVADFIKLTHEEYKKRLGDKLGNEMPGFFTDEPQYYRWDSGVPYSDVLPGLFEKKYGYSLFDYLPALFIDFYGADEFRYDYYYLCHELFTESFMKQIYDWCDDNNCQLTGHACEERSLAGQMMCCGGVMPFYEYEHIPGIDFLARFIGNVASQKQVGSVAAQLGRKKVLSEMFACCGWDIRPVDLKLIAEHMYSGGVNLMCQHLYPFSELGQRKRDYPCHYSEHLSWQKYLKKFNDYFSGLGYALSRGEEIAPTLVIHPIHSCYLKYKPLDRSNSLAELDDEFAKLVTTLSDNKVLYHFGDELIMRKHAEVKDGKIIIGKCSYDNVIIPSLYSLDKNTFDLLAEFKNQGGKIYYFGIKPDRIDGKIADLSSVYTDLDIKEIYSSSPVSVSGNNSERILISERETEYGKIIYIFNQSDEITSDITVSLSDCSHVCRINLETMRYESVKQEKDNCGLNVYLDFKPSESFVLLDNSSFNETESESLLNTQYISVPERMRLSESPVNSLTLDKAKIKYGDDDSYSESRPIERIRDNLIKEKYNGKVSLKFEFDVADYSGPLFLAVEPNHNLLIKVNGVNQVPDDSVSFFDNDIICYDISNVCKQGINSIEYEFDYYQSENVYNVLYGGFTEALRNCLSFDTEIEAIYLFGSFSVLTEADKFNNCHHNSYEYSGKFALSDQKEIINVREIVKEGYPFFFGEMTLEFSVDYSSGKPYVLYLPGRYAVAEISVNDTLAGVLDFGHYINLKEFLSEGNNNIRIKLLASDRNLLGPHHFIDTEPLAQGPEVFSFEKQWDNDVCPNYKPRYAFTRFGIGECD